MSDARSEREELALNAARLLMTHTKPQRRRFQAEIAKFGGQVCGGPGQHHLGKLTQIGNRGYLSFRLPDVPAGDYYSVAAAALLGALVTMVVVVRGRFGS